MGKGIRKRLGEILIDDGLITEEQLKEALDLQKASTDFKPLGETLVELDYLTEEGLSLAISKKLGLKYVSFADGSLNIMFDQNLDEMINERFAQEHQVIPFAKTQRYLSVAMWDPLNFVVVDNLRKMTKMELIIHCTTKMDIKIGIDKLYHSRGGLDNEENESERKELAHGYADEKENVDELKSKAAEAPVIKMVNSLIQNAVNEKASDIHIDPREDGVWVRYRTDGILYERPPFPRDMLAPVISRIKILSRLDISEKRLPQDGGFMATVKNRSVDLRVSTIPTIYGEKLTIRILDRDDVNVDIYNIGLNLENTKKVLENIKKPNGLICLTGPTGSGKTTSLYCMLNEIKSVQKNIITIEDPVEYRIDGVNQVQAKPQIGLDFARGLRTFLRQDPDVIMVGEVRDLETAEICVRSALVGRLVLSTLHTNDSVGSIARLLDFGVEPFLLSSTLNMVIAQRLVRKLCPQCKERLIVDKRTSERYKLNDVNVYAPKGCDACQQRGYLGRIGIFEILVIDNDIKGMIERNENLGVIKDYLVREKGMKTLREDGLAKVRAGVTSLEEVLGTTIDTV